jgi:hypothetical protein
MASDFLCQQAGFESTPIYNMTGGMLAWEGVTVGCCYSNGDCDDSLFCNGEELCVDLNCKPGTYPCDPYYGCDEVSLCWEHAGDADCDGLADGEDNCVEVANSTVFGTCAETIGTLLKGTGVVCTSDDDCGTGESCQMNQEDCNSNGIGDACECYADFDGDGNVYPGDLSVFLGEYGRTDCLTNPPCYADFDQDGTVYPGDLSVIVDEYGREDCPLVP